MKKHQWDKGFAHKGRVLHLTVRCQKCQAPLIPSPVPEGWRDNIESFKNREDCRA